MSQLNNRDTQPEISRLVTEFTSKDSRVRGKARKSLIAFGELAITPLVPALSNQDRWVRWEIAKTLAEMRNPEVAQILVRELENKTPDLLCLAAEGLLALGSRGLEPLLKALIDNPDSYVLQQGAHHILHDLYTGGVHPGEENYLTPYRLGSDLRKAIKGVLDALDDVSGHVVLPTMLKIALNAIKSQKLADSPD